MVGKQVLVGQLADDFLRPSEAPAVQGASQQEMIDRQLAMQLQHQLVGSPSYSGHGYAGQLVMTVVEVMLII